MGEGISVCKNAQYIKLNINSSRWSMKTAVSRLTDGMTLGTEGQAQEVYLENESDAAYMMECICNECC